LATGNAKLNVKDVDVTVLIETEDYIFPFSCIFSLFLSHSSGPGHGWCRRNSCSARSFIWLDSMWIITYGKKQLLYEPIIKMSSFFYVCVCGVLACLPAHLNVFCCVFTVLSVLCWAHNFTVSHIRWGEWRHEKGKRF